MTLRQMVDQIKAQNHEENKTLIFSHEDKVIKKTDNVTLLIQQINEKIEKNESKGLLDLLWQLFQNTKHDAKITPCALKSFFQKINPIAEHVIPEGEVAIKNLMITYFQTIPTEETEGECTREKSHMRLLFAEENIDAAMAKCQELFLRNPHDREVCAIMMNYLKQNLTHAQIKTMLNVAATSPA